MNGRRRLPCLLLAAVAIAPDAPTATGSPAPDCLENTEVGYSLRYPPDWRVGGQVVSTEFATAARCESVAFVDSEPPAGSGPAPFIRRSFVQICARRVTDGLSLDEFMRRTYGASWLGSFSPTQLGGWPGYRAGREAAQTTIFLQTRVHRIQIVAVVNTGADLAAQRSAEVAAILESLSFARGP